MELEETPHHHDGGIHNYFEGATINNLYVNSTVNKYAQETFNNSVAGNNNYVITAEILKKALEECQDFIWGNSAYGVVFCVCRDAFNAENNASSFERLLAECDVKIPAGTINAALNRNTWMRYHIDSWKEMGAMERALALRDEIRSKIEIHLTKMLKSA